MNEMKEHTERDILSADLEELHELFAAFLAFLSEGAKENNYQLNLIAKIVKLLFHAKLPIGRIKNQKFDFSINSKTGRIIRFSYNDFGEREGSYLKYLKIYGILTDFCNLDAIKKIFEAMPQKDHQTTFGVEIAHKKEECRFKLYFEDMNYSPEHIKERLRGICSAIGYDYNRIVNSIKNERIRAIGLDFVYGKKTILKLYCRRNNLQGVNNRLSKKFKDFFQPQEGEFYYLTHIFKNREELKNKIYKVFNVVKNSQNNDRNVRQIHNYFLSLGKVEKSLLKLFNDTLSFAREQDIVLIPVLLSVAEKNTLYFTLRKKQGESRRVEYFIVNKCTNNCLFCSEHHKFDGTEIGMEKIENVLKSEKGKGAELIHFMGGEPTLHSQFFSALQKAKEMGFRTYIMTNGARFCYEKYCNKVLPLLDEISVSIHGSNSMVHDGQTRNKGSFDILVRGLKNICRDFKGELIVNTTLTNKNYTDLANIARLIERFGIRKWNLINVIPSGNAEENFFEIIPRLRHLRKPLKDLLEFIGSKNILLRISGIPLCLFNGKYEYSYDYLSTCFKLDNLEVHNNKLNLWLEPGNTNDKIDIGRIKPVKCKACRLNQFCGGIYYKYSLKYGTSEIKPIK